MTVVWCAGSGWRIVGNDI